MRSLAFFCFILVGCGGTTTGGPADGGSPSSSTGAGGGTGSSGAGTGGSGTGGGGPCTAGTTSFHMSAASGPNDRFCVGLQCSATWMTVTSMSGEEMPLSAPCETPCDTCQPVGCPAICVAPQVMKPDGERLTWDGTFWQASTCGAHLACRGKACAAPGRYKVKMCAAARTSDAGPIPGFCSSPDTTPTCVELEFDYPSSSTVEGML
jgi:hypothetical protein